MNSTWQHKADLEGKLGTTGDFYQLFPSKNQTGRKRNLVNVTVSPHLFHSSEKIKV
jgi:hypothetical protein